MSDQLSPEAEKSAEQRKKSEETIQRTLKQIEAFGYVDINWIVSAFARDYNESYQPPEAGEPKQKKGLKGFFQMFGLFRDRKPAPQQWPGQRLSLASDMTQADRLFLLACMRRLRSLLQTIPLPPTLSELESRNGKRPNRRGGSHYRGPKDKAVENAQLKRIAKFMRKSGLEETGFPIRLIGDKGDGGPVLNDEQTLAAAEADTSTKVSAPVRPKVEQAGGVTINHADMPKPEDRNKALSVLTGGLLYRFAYDQNKSLKWEDTQKVFRATGVYRLYVITPDAGLVERRLLLVTLGKHGAIVRAAEIRKRRGKLVARGGYVVPAAGVNTIVLSSDLSPTVLGDMIQDELSLEARDLVFPPDQDDDAASSASFLQEHQMGFYSLYSRGEGELRGSIMEGPTPSAVVGYKVKPELIDLREVPQDEAPIVPSDPDASFSALPTPQKRRIPEVSILEMHEIEDRRDRMLVAAISQNPAVSIDIG